MTAVAINEEVVVVNFPQTQNVSGTVDVGNFPAVQEVTGSVTVTGLTFSGSINSTPAPSNTHTTTNFPASLSSQMALGSNPNRRGASFFNCMSGKGTCYLAIGSSASTASFMVALRPGSYYSFDVVPSEPISFVFDQIPGNVMVTEQS
jgi:hypothetical protein